MHWSRLRRDPNPSPASEGGPPQAPPEGPGGGALPEAHAFKRFGFTRAKKYVDFGPCFEGNLAVDSLRKSKKTVFKSVQQYLVW